MYIFYSCFSKSYVSISVIIFMFICCSEKIINKFLKLVEVVGYQKNLLKISIKLINIQKKKLKEQGYLLPFRHMFLVWPSLQGLLCIKDLSSICLSIRFLDRLSFKLLLEPIDITRYIVILSYMSLQEKKMTTSNEN